MSKMKTTTYPVEWKKIVNLEDSLLGKFSREPEIKLGINLLMICLGSRFGLRISDLISLRWKDLLGKEVNEEFIITEKKTNKNRTMMMTDNVRKTFVMVYEHFSPNPNHFIFCSQKSDGSRPMSVWNFNHRLKQIFAAQDVKTMGNVSSHMLRKSFVVSSIKKGMENGDPLSLVKVSRLINHSSVKTTLYYTNFEVSTLTNLYNLD